MESRFADVPCPRCETWAQLDTVPLRLVTGGTAWQALCDECFRAELKVEPWDDLLMRPVPRTRRGRRR
jgi:hypothetical protein